MRDAAGDPELASLLAAAATEPDPLGATAIAGRAAIVALHTAGRLRHPGDRVAAASLLLQGERVEEVRLAERLLLAELKGQPAARPLAARAFDRLRRLAGQPQKFGTEVVAVGERFELWPVDGVTTDSERAKWGIAPLAELQRLAAGRAR
ncbi:MAG: hypothetical protein JNL12_15735 [Planctomycetes bacterium]|nr:hypothetical protein [Planctomycetota bacterium]